MAERAGHDVPLLHASEATRRKLELVVGVLVGEHAHRDDDTLLAGDVVRDADLALQSTTSRHRRDLVEKDRPHLSSFRTPWRAAGPEAPTSWTGRAYPPPSTPLPPRH